MSDQPPQNKPPEGEIPDILEWKLDVIMEQLANMGGGRPDPVLPPRTRERLPPPKDRKPGDPIPHLPGIPEILEWKLEAIIYDLDDIVTELAAPPGGGIRAGLAAIAGILGFIFAALMLIAALLFMVLLVLLNINALLAFILALFVFVIGLFVPLFILRGRHRRHLRHR